jgi:hypothetical protein
MMMNKGPIFKPEFLSVSSPFLFKEQKQTLSANVNPICE